MHPERDLHSNSTTVHDYMPIVCKTCVTWAPLWIPVDDPDADPIRSLMLMLTLMLIPL